MARKAKKKARGRVPVDEMDPEAEGDNADSVDGSGEAMDVDEALETKGKSTKSKRSKSKTQSKNDGESRAGQATIPFMDAFYELSAEDSPEDRSVAAGALIQHCFFTNQRVNHKDAAYALTRLMNGLCTGRAASRQGFASCLSSFLRVAHSSPLNENGVDAMGDILKEDDYAKGTEGNDHPSAIVRKKMLSITQYLAAGVNGTGNRHKDKEMKGIEARDHAFGRLFGILAVVRSGILGSRDIPDAVVEGYIKDLIDLYNKKVWMREPSSHALIELLSSLETKSNHSLIGKVANDIIIPSFFPSTGGALAKGRDMWLQKLSPEQIAIALRLQMPHLRDIEYGHPLNESILTPASIPNLAMAFGSTSTVVYPRCHIVWKTLWIYLTEEVKGKGFRQLRANEEFASIIEKIIDHVVVGNLLRAGQEKLAPTNECRSLALQLVCTLSGSSLGEVSEIKLALPPHLLCHVLSPDVVTGLFLRVLRASGGVGKKKSKEAVEHHLKSLTSQALASLLSSSCEHGDLGRRLACAKCFILADPRFDINTRTNAVSTLLMLQDNGGKNEDCDGHRMSLWKEYVTFLEEKTISATSIHDATVYIELMYKLAKSNLKQPPANLALKVAQFFMSGAFFNCATMALPSATISPGKKKKEDDKRKFNQNISPALRIKELLEKYDMNSISHPARSIMSARFYSLLSDLISVINTWNRKGNESNSFYEKGRRPESIYRLLSEVCGVCSILETSCQRTVPAMATSLDDSSEGNNQFETSKQSMLEVRKIANEALVGGGDGSESSDVLQSKAVFSTGYASLMMSLYLQLYSCGGADNAEEREDEDEITEAAHEFISDLAEIFAGFIKIIEDDKVQLGDEENPLAAMAELLVNILSSPVGGQAPGEANSIQDSASKLVRETVKLAWSGVISLVTHMSKKNNSLHVLFDEEVMNILLESVVGEKLMGGRDEEDDDKHIDSSDSSDEASDQEVASATDEGNIDEMKDNASDKDQEETEKNDDDIELAHARVQSMLLEDSDAEMSDSEVLEHHAGADSALAKLILMKQEARKTSQTERERIDLCNRSRCASLLDATLSPSVFAAGWLPIEAILGLIVPILRSRRAVEKSLVASASTNAKKSSAPKKVFIDRLSDLVTKKISKYRCSDGQEPKELALKVSSDVYEEMKHSLNRAHCLCCCLSLITAFRCIPDVEDNADVKIICAAAVDDWSSRKATKIHACAFEALIQRLPSLASVVLVEPLMAAAKGAHSSFLKCESIKLLSYIYNLYSTTAEKDLSEEAKATVRDHCSSFAERLKDALSDSSLQKKKHRDEILGAIKHYINYLESRDVGVSTNPALSELQGALKGAEASSESKGKKQLYRRLSDKISEVSRQRSDLQQKPKRKKESKSSKKSKKQKK